MNDIPSVYCASVSPGRVAVGLKLIARTWTVDVFHIHHQPSSRQKNIAVHIVRLGLARLDDLNLISE